MILKGFINLILRLGKKIKNPLPYLIFFQKHIAFFDKFIPFPKHHALKKSTLGGTKVEIIYPLKGCSSSTIFYVHGGGFIMGLSNLYRKFACILARMWKAKIILIDYSLSPQHQFPIALTETLNAYKALLKEQGIKNVIIAGDSAGANLVLSTLLAAKKQFIPMPSCAVIFSGWLNLNSRERDSDIFDKKDPFISTSHLFKIAKAYLPSHIMPNSPLVSPVYGNLKGLPRLFIQVGTKELFLEDAYLITHKAQEQELSVHLEISPTMTHAYPIIFSTEPKSLALFHKVYSFIKESQNN